MFDMKRIIQLGPLTNARHIMYFTHRRLTIFSTFLKEI